ncbi:hypothetical protein MYX07_00305 [Patescibacteria group bacterium AH-259-L07]|nr:hypothetical protein [Patescibacteria group bacterium AH-259-L07]
MKDIEERKKVNLDNMKNMKEKITSKDLKEDNEKQRIFITMALCDKWGFIGMPIGLFVGMMEEIGEKYPNYRIEKMETSQNTTRLHDNLHISIIKEI